MSIIGRPATSSVAPGHLAGAPAARRRAGRRCPCTAGSGRARRPSGPSGSAGGATRSQLASGSRTRRAGSRAPAPGSTPHARPGRAGPSRCGRSPGRTTRAVAATERRRAAADFGTGSCAVKTTASPRRADGGRSAARPAAGRDHWTWTTSGRSRRRCAPRRRRSSRCSAALATGPQPGADMKAIAAPVEVLADRVPGRGGGGAVHEGGRPQGDLVAAPGEGTGELVIVRARVPGGVDERHSEGSGDQSLLQWG